MNTTPASVSAAYDQKIKTQYLQDFGFEKLTMIFAATTLVALLGIIVSLFISAWPALKEFGIPFFYTVEWDIINEEFGAAISIVGTVLSAGLAMLIAVPLAFGMRRIHSNSVRMRLRALSVSLCSL
jgi:phosphate transport system permease protein